MILYCFAVLMIENPAKLVILSFTYQKRIISTYCFINILHLRLQMETFAKLVDVSRFQSCSSTANEDITSRKACR